MLLRPWQTGDVDALVEACNDPEVQKWTAVPDPYTKADAEAWVRGDPLPEEPPGDRVAFAVAANDDPDRLIGSMSIMRVERGALGEIGYWTATWGRGRGATTRAVRLLATWGMGEFELRRVELVIAIDNDPSNRVAEKAGFTNEGTLRQYRQAKGIWRDHYMWSLLRDEL